MYSENGECRCDLCSRQVVEKVVELTAETKEPSGAGRPPLTSWDVCLECFALIVSPILGKPSLVLDL